ncbi:MAG TPA: endonuclease III [Candidatus Eisenbacteria bacterium]|uniref:Endonuclease III n=1 Tax=Eiseniibacteriota bacterium TaxID=2212470 RepID=A0A7V2AVY1_UNCEI|nr:endonuclease III [Candidatus Eisenbacteria bacterium]
MRERANKYPVKSEWFPLGRSKAAALLRRSVPLLRKAVGRFDDPSVTAIARRTKSPFRILVSTVISARTKDEVTGAASERLFSRAKGPAEMARLRESEIAKLIYPAGFYRTKAKAIRALSRRLVEDHGGRVPRTIEELVELPGVGRKTANLVVTLAFGGPGICVDTHVHRIVNRLGAVRTRNPRETEFALRSVLPREHWLEINDLLVMFGKGVCAPISPRCSICPLEGFCSKAGVARSR